MCRGRGGTRHITVPLLTLRRHTPRPTLRDGLVPAPPAGARSALAEEAGRSGRSPRPATGPWGRTGARPRSCSTAGPSGAGRRGRRGPGGCRPGASATSVRTVPSVRSACSVTAAVGDRARERRPAGPAVELVLRREQRLAGHDVHEDAVAALAVERARPGPLGPVLLRHAVGDRAELAAELGVGTAWSTRARAGPPAGRRGRGRGRRGGGSSWVWVSWRRRTGAGTRRSPRPPGRRAGRSAGRRS